MALKKKTLFYYSMTDLPIHLALFPVAVFIPMFYTSNMGISLALVANLILVVRILDVFTDPLCGYLSDKTDSRWGRRRPWIAAATPLMMISIYMLFLPSGSVGGGYLFAWMVVLSVGTTMMMIPYYAWAAELSPDFHERSRITGWRSMFGVVGSLLAQLVPVIALLVFGFGGTDAILTVVGITMLIVMPICVTLTLANVNETRDYVRTTTPVLAGFKLMLENGPFLRLILAFMVSNIGLAITTPLYIFFITFVLKAEANSPFMLTFFYLANFSAIPFWVWLSKKIGKHRAYICSFAVIAFAHPFYLLLGEGDFWWMLPVTLATGFAAGGFAAIPNSMKADVIDLDTIKSGENRAALFFSTWSFTIKMAMSLGGWLALYGLSFWGFDPNPEAVNGADELFGLRFMFSLFPSLFFLAAGAIIWKYPITEERHKEMREELTRRSGGEAVAAS